MANINFFLRGFSGSEIIIFVCTVPFKMLPKGAPWLIKILPEPRQTTDLGFVLQIKNNSATIRIACAMQVCAGFCFT